MPSMEMEQLSRRRIGRTSARHDHAHTGRHPGLDPGIGNEALARLLAGRPRVNADNDAFERDAGRAARLAPPIAASIPESTGAPRALDPATRAPLERAWGHDLSDVQVHTGSVANAATRAVGARAFTIGQHIVLGHDPSSSWGDSASLLTHELAHVVQQRAAPFDRSAAPGGIGAAGAPQLRIGPAGPQLQRANWLTALFGSESYSDKELRDYLAVIDRKQAIEDNYDSDNKARAVVKRWRRGDPAFILPPKRKILLIREMLSGATLDADEQAILALMRGSTNEELVQILNDVGLERLNEDFHFAEQDQLDELLARRIGITLPKKGQKAAVKGKGPSKEIFDPETMLEAQERFTSNAELERHVRQSCIIIMRTMTPQLLRADPQLAKRAATELGKLKGMDLTMNKAGDVMVRIGAASAPVTVKFKDGNGRNEPNELVTSAWDQIIHMVGSEYGWHVFGLAVMSGHHSVTVIVDNRPDGPKVYWADQWAIGMVHGVPENFRQLPGSVSGFRQYDKPGFDQWIEELTKKMWNSVHKADSACAQRREKKGKHDWDTFCRYPATLFIWKFYSRST